MEALTLCAKKPHLMQTIWGIDEETPLSLLKQFSVKSDMLRSPNGIPTHI